MINIYEKYYLSEENRKRLLEEAVIIFDTSALLDLYYYSKETQEAIFGNVFGYLKERLWIPSQVQFEFLKNRIKVSEKPIATYESLIQKPKNGDGGHIEKITEFAFKIQSDELKKIRNQIKTLKEKTIRNEKHPYIENEVYEQIENDIEKFEEQVNFFQNKIREFEKIYKKIVDTKIEEIRNNAFDDRVLNIVDSVFKIGNEYNYDKLMEVAEEGEFRYKHQIPPGYEDEENKVGLQIYGDLFAWKQILDYAQKQKKDVLLISNDVKKDWYDSEQEAPRYELLREFNSIAKKSFWMYNITTFLREINILLDETNKIDDDVLQEIGDIQLSREEKIDQEIDVENALSQVFEGKIHIIEPVPIEDTWKVFLNPFVYLAEDDDGKKILISINFVKGNKYVNTLHPLKNIYEIKKYYEKNMVLYDYYQFTIASNKNTVIKLIEYLNKPNPKKLFEKEAVRAHIGYVDEEQIVIVQKNYSRSYG